ncbi:late blight resistance homolog R1B-16 isoform X1 [Olea europaea subsp. europaea]|uniref:Late blight resistance homolog R1B-16 isoform X1 n=1 Tax=Olea europaea subsp. europaea TaxID=158383 RepID=A0A8S0SMZ8_OLEEU|nr:late blight resistance homolog R1B-16 isoform X1 [Olea europaea subsp. europaea]
MAHAAVVSLMHILEQIRHGDGVSDPSENILLVPLLEKLSSLLSFLEESSQSSREEVKSLERKIRDAAYHAEDVFESRVSDRLLSKQQNLSANMPSAETYHLDLQKIMTEIDTIVEEVLEIEDVKGEQNLQPRNLLPSGSAPSGQVNMVGFAQDLVQIRERLCHEQQSQLQIVPIVGIGGMGKTTLTMNVFNDSYIKYRFDIRAWVTLFEQYRMRDILLSLLDDFVVTDHIREEDEEILKEHLYKNLKGRRYLIVVDDVRSIEVWNDIKMLFPNDRNGSRIILTSRLKDVADYVNSSNAHHQMRYLHEEESWNLFLAKAFGKENCPLDLVDVGTKIAKNCQGLPLLIVVISGLLSKVNKAKDYWEYVAENLNSIVAEKDDRCLEILNFSYKHLPAHLKACFLYMGVFPENYEIPVSKLIKLWVAEGFLKPHESKHLEEVAQEYLRNLIDRNLVLVRQKGSINGKVKTCIMHGLLRELCVRMAYKEEFLCVKSKNFVPEKEILLRRLCIHDDASYSPNEEDMTIQSMSLVRSFIYSGWDDTHLHSYYYFGCGLLRTLDMIGVELTKFPDEILQLVNLRYIAITGHDLVIPPSIAFLKNLQTLVVEDPWKITIFIPKEIFNMPQLRHLKLSRVSLFCCFSLPLTDGDKTFVLENLETLSNVEYSGMSEDFLEKIPNVKKLGIIYRHSWWSFFDVHLQTLETLKIFFETRSDSIFLQSITSSPGLKKITLEHGSIDWKNMTIFGKLPNLEVLKLREFAFSGPEWVPTEGEFLKLKFLLIWETDLEQWRADSTHFPRLEHLILQKCSKLVEIPSDIGEIQTLKIIEIDNSSPSVVKSAKDMLQEQLDQGNEVLDVLFHQTKERLNPLKHRGRKLVLKVGIRDEKEKQKAMKLVSSFSGTKFSFILLFLLPLNATYPTFIAQIYLNDRIINLPPHIGVESLAMDLEEKLSVFGDVDPVGLVSKLRKSWRTELISVGPAN